MGKGDKRTRRGKIYNGSHGKIRSRKPKSSAADKTVTKGTARKTATRGR